MPNITQQSTITTPLQLSMHDIYFKLTEEYKHIYGEKTMVLLQVGAFFEVYGKIENDTDNEYDSTMTVIGSNIQEFTQICDLNISLKIKEQKIVMAGFRDYSLDKYIDKLLNKGYTVVVFTQTKENPNDKTMTRQLYGIFSPGTIPIDDYNKITNHTMCIRLQYIQPSRINPKPRIVLGMAVVDVLTGKCNFTEHQTEYSHNPSTYDELEKYYSMYNPSELLVLFNSNDITQEKVESILQFIGNKSKTTHLIDLDKDDTTLKQEIIQGINMGLTKYRYTLEHRARNCEKPVYKTELLKQYYEIENISSFIESIRFHYYECASHCFAFLLDFLYSHNANLVKRIQTPTIYQETNHMVLANHSLKQLNFLSNGEEQDFGYGGQTQKHSSVISFLNNCITPMGKRSMNLLMTHPIINAEELKHSYDAIEYVLLPEKYEDFMNVRSQLKTLKDMEKMYRKIILNRTNPSDIWILFSNIETIHTIYKGLQKHIDFFHTQCNKEELFEQAIMNYSILYNHLVSCMNFSIPMNEVDTFNTHFFKQGYNIELDEAYRNYLESNDIVEALRYYFSDLIKLTETKPKDSEYCVIHETEKSGIMFKLTATRCDKLLKKLSKQIETIHFTSSYNGEKKKISIDTKKIGKTMNGKNVYLSSQELDIFCNNVTETKETFKKQLQTKFMEINEELKSMKETFLALIDFVIYLDVLITKAYNAYTFNYSKPTVDLDTSKDAYLQATDMRHLLIEQFQTDKAYVPNSVSLGCRENKDDKNDTNGILLFGTNAVGKSSLIKAIGICVLLAQSGMYVPCKSFEFRPFKSIFTRILGNDNIFKGLSTFAVEMSELRTILLMSDENSLVLGDELCSGTEMGSALSIFSAGLIQLHQRNSKFIFATHFHEVCYLKQIQDLQKMRLKHMSVYYDVEKEQLIYDRRLKDGQGNNMYGLEVCKSLNLPNDFLNLALGLRSELLQDNETIASHKQSKYNKDKLMGMCEICKRKGVEIHHIKQQKDADERGYVDGIHKNHKSNLMCVCEECHDSIHS